MTHLDTSRLITPSRRTPIKPLIGMATGYVKGVGRNIAWVMNDNKAQSLPFLLSMGIAIGCQTLHAIVEHPERWGIWFALPAAFCGYTLFKIWDKDPTCPAVGQYARLVATFVWMGLTIVYGVMGELALAGVLILGSWYSSFFKMIVTVQNMPKTELILPPKEPDPEPEIPYKGIPWLEGAIMSAPRNIPTGTEQTLTLPKKSNPKDFVRNRVHDFANVEQLPASKLELIDPGTGYTVVVRKHTTKDILAQKQSWPWADRSITDTREPMPIGYNRSGEVRYLQLRKGHVLIGGATGSGKSVTFSQITAAAALDPNADLFGIDPKRADLRSFRHSMRAYVQNDYDQALQVLRYVAKSIPERMEITDQYGVENVAAIPRRGNQQVLPTYFLLIDELAHLTVDAPREIRDEATRLIGVVLKQGRAADVWLIAATQRPSVETIPGDLRDQFMYALCLRVRSQVTTGMVLGDNPGVDASEIPVDRPGVGYFQSDTGIELIRSGYLPTSEKDRLAALAPAAVGRLRPEPELHPGLDPLPTDDGGVARLPNGEPIPPDWKGDLWEALQDGEWRSVAELAAIVGRTNNPVRTQLRRWTEQRLLAESVDGQVTKWKRAA